jgi:hypothetical protein
MKAIEDELDSLVQQWSNGKRCQMCQAAMATETHHIGRKKTPLERYDLQNLMPVCHNCHTEIHNGHLNAYDKISLKQRVYIETMKNMSYKNFLIFELGMTEDEFLRDCKRRFKELVK